MSDSPTKVGYFDTYEAARTAALKKIKAAAEDSDNDVLEELSREADPKEKVARMANCQAVQMITDKCMEQYREGDYPFEDALKELIQALKRIK